MKRTMKCWLLFVSLMIASLTANALEINCKWVYIEMDGQGDWKYQCDTVPDLPPDVDPPPPGAGTGGGGGCTTCGGPDYAEIARLQRCRDNQQSRDALQCVRIRKTAPTIIEALNIPEIYKPGSNIWGPAVLGFAVNAFNKPITVNEISAALGAGIQACGDSRNNCISQLEVFFGQRVYMSSDIPVVGQIADALDQFRRAFDPPTYARSDAAKVVDPWTNGQECLNLAATMEADKCLNVR